MTAPDINPLLSAAKAWFDAGFAVVPSHEDGGKRPYGRWKEFQSQRMHWDELESLLSTDRFTGIGVLTGRTSGDVEMLEIEGPPDLAVKRLAKVIAQADEFAAIGVRELLMRVTLGCVEQSAGGGLHLFIRVSDGVALGNTKLATVEGKVVAETRGEGGFVIVAPTPGRNGHPEGASYIFVNGGSPAKVVDVSSEERDMLHMLFSISLNVDIHPTETIKEPAKADSTFDGTSAFDDYREKVSWREILEPAGWTWSHGDAERDYWVRPGKTKSEGISASTIDDGPLVNFSSSVNMPLQVGLSKASVHAHLHHGGDLSSAARSLGDQGFGSGITYADLPAWAIPEPDVVTPDAPEPSAADQAYQNAVERKYAEMRVVDDAKQLMATVKAGQAPDLNGILLHDFLDQPDEAAQFRIAELWPAQGRVLLAAAAKSGKTTLVAANLLPSLVDGRDFLGKHKSTPVTGKVVLFNMEVGENTLRRWLRDSTVTNRHKVIIANLRGKASALSLSTEKGRDRLVGFLKSVEAEVVILDPLAPVLASLGLDENSNTDIAQFFGWWSQVLADAEVADDVVVHHTGHAGQRSRGASRLLDEPDAVWTLTRDTDEKTGEFAQLDPIRYLSAYGRDVEMQPESLKFDQATRLLTLTGKGKAATKDDEETGAIVGAFKGMPTSKNEIQNRIKGNRSRIGQKIEEMVIQGLILEVGKGAKGVRLLMPASQMESS